MMYRSISPTQTRPGKACPEAHAQACKELSMGVKECSHLWGEGAGKQGF